MEQWNNRTMEQWSSGQWTVDSGQWTVDSGQWTVDSGQWVVESRNGRAMGRQEGDGITPVEDRKAENRAAGWGAVPLYCRTFPWPAVLSAAARRGRRRGRRDILPRSSA